jgi:hypothetical protein
VEVDTECYSVYCEVLAQGNIENNWYFLLLSLLCGSGGRQYIGVLILNVTVFVVRVWRSVIYRGTDTECYSLC